MKVASTECAAARECCATVELGLKEGGGIEEAERVTAVEFTHHELFGMFQKLEKIQQQLDRL